MPSPSSRLRTVLKRLPFSVDDTEAANDAFRRWVQGDDPDAGRLLDMWTYCYVCRYFLAKSAGGALTEAAAPDELITRTFTKVQDKRDGVRNPDRYANWVSVVCKNTFLNYMRRDRVAASVDDDEGPTLTAQTSHAVSEMGFVREAFEEAIERLPAYLQEPARRYFLEDQDFEEISEALEKPVPTIRTYKHKAVKRLRKDERLRSYVESTDL